MPAMQQRLIPVDVKLPFLTSQAFPFKLQHALNRFSSEVIPAQCSQAKIQRAPVGIRRGRDGLGTPP
jgi:hypothetical protein